MNSGSVASSYSSLKLQIDKTKSRTLFSDVWASLRAIPLLLPLPLLLCPQGPHLCRPLHRAQGYAGKVLPPHLQGGERLRGAELEEPEEGVHALGHEQDEEEGDEGAAQNPGHAAMEMQKNVCVCVCVPVVYLGLHLAKCSPVC